MSEVHKTFFVNERSQRLQFAFVTGDVLRKLTERAVGREIPTGGFAQGIRDRDNPFMGQTRKSSSGSTYASMAPIRWKKRVYSEMFFLCSGPSS